MPVLLLFVASNKTDKMKHIFYYLGCIILFLQITACSPESAPPTKYLRWVGDISHDPKIDKKNFQLCTPKAIKQYHNFSFGFLYKGEKIALENEIRSQYNEQHTANQSGWLRIRFVVNCHGETDRFRIIGMDNNKEAFTFDQSISEQLLSICKNLKGWLILPDNDAPQDYYIYLTFKLDNGKIKAILP